MIVQARIAEATPGHKIDEWPVKQLFSKMDGLLGSEGHVSMRSKQYYLTAIFDLYFEPDKLSESDVVQCWYRRVLLIYIKHGLKDSPYGKKILRLKAYQEAFDNYDFVPFQQARGLVGEFYTALLPYTKDFEYNITGTVS